MEAKMYKIEKKDFGYRLTFDGFIKADEMQRWVDESRKQLSGAPAEFGVFVDMRTLKPLPADSQVALEKGQLMYKEKGMQRSVVIVSSKIVKMQFQRIAEETGIYKWERYIDASTEPDWEKAGIDWIIRAVDPDHRNNAKGC